MRNATTGGEVLILVFTPYEVEMIQMALKVAVSKGVSPQELHAIERVTVKTEDALRERLGSNEGRSKRHEAHLHSKHNS